MIVSNEARNPIRGPRKSSLHRFLLPEETFPVKTMPKPCVSVQAYAGTSAVQFRQKTPWVMTIPKLRRLIPAYASRHEGPTAIMAVMEPEIISGRPLIQYPCRWEYKVIGWTRSRCARPLPRSWPTATTS